MAHKLIATILAFTDMPYTNMHYSYRAGVGRTITLNLDPITWSGDMQHRIEEMQHMSLKNTDEGVLHINKTYSMSE